MKQSEYTLVISTRGHYNLLDPSQESISTHIAVMNPDGSKKMSVNISTEDEIDNDADLVAEIEQYNKRVWSSRTKEVEAFCQYLKDNSDNLYIGNLQREHVELTKRRDGINSRIAWIENMLSEQGYFKNGMWFE